MLTSLPSIDTLWSRLASPPISRQFQGCTSSISRSAQVQSYSNSYCMCCLGSDNQHLDKTWQSAWNMQKTSVKDIVMITPHLAQGAVHNKHVSPDQHDTFHSNIDCITFNISARGDSRRHTNIPSVVPLLSHLHQFYRDPRDCRGSPTPTARHHCQL